MSPALEDLFSFLRFASVSTDSSLALPDARSHAPNENFPVGKFEAGIRLNQALFK